MDIDKIIPADELRETIQKFEDIRKSRIDENINSSGIIKKLNKYLFNSKRVVVIMWAGKTGRYTTIDTGIEMYERSPVVADVKNKELLDWLRKKYKDAGYRVDYTDFSDHKILIITL